MGTKAAWTDERRAQQAVRIRLSQPWKQSTGPRPPEGKAISSRNADKGVAEGRRGLREDKKRLREIMKRAECLFGRFRMPTSATPRRKRRPEMTDANGDELWQRIAAGPIPGPDD